MSDRTIEPCADESPRSRLPQGWHWESDTCAANGRGEGVQGPDASATCVEAWRLHAHRLECQIRALENQAPPAADELTAEDWEAYADATSLATPVLDADPGRWERLTRIARTKARDLKSRAGGGS